MSFEDREDCFLWRCDGKGCDRFVAFKPHDFYACVAELKAREWSFSPPDYGPDGGDWEHYCQRCQFKHRQASMMDRQFKTVK